MSLSVRSVSGSGQSSSDFAVESLPEPVFSSESFEDANNRASRSGTETLIAPLAVQVDSVHEFMPMVRDIHDFSLTPDQAHKSALVYLAEEPENISVLPAFVLGMETIKALNLPTFVAYSFTTKLHGQLSSNFMLLLSSSNDEQRIGHQTECDDKSHKNVRQIGHCLSFFFPSSRTITLNTLPCC